MNELYDQFHKNDSNNPKLKDAAAHSIKKEKFETPHMEIVTFDSEDVISTSGCNGVCYDVCSPTDCRTVCNPDCRSVG